MGVKFQFQLLGLSSVVVMAEDRGELEKQRTGNGTGMRMGNGNGSDTIQRTVNNHRTGLLDSSKLPFNALFHVEHS